jgi:hypothetical protein
VAEDRKKPEGTDANDKPSPLQARLGSIASGRASTQGGTPGAPAAPSAPAAPRPATSGQHARTMIGMPVVTVPPAPVHSATPGGPPGAIGTGAGVPAAPPNGATVEGSAPTPNPSDASASPRAMSHLPSPGPRSATVPPVAPSSGVPQPFAPASMKSQPIARAAPPKPPPRRTPVTGVPAIPPPLGSPPPAAPPLASAPAAPGPGTTKTMPTANVPPAPRASSPLASAPAAPTPPRAATQPVATLPTGISTLAAAPAAPATPAPAPATAPRVGTTTPTTSLPRLGSSTPTARTQPEAPALPATPLPPVLPAAPVLPQAPPRASSTIRTVAVPPPAAPPQEAAPASVSTSTPDPTGFGPSTFVDTIPPATEPRARATADDLAAAPLVLPPSPRADSVSSLPLKPNQTGVGGPFQHAPSDRSAPRTLVEQDPAPLPPSPQSSRDAEVWFEEAPTRPSSLGDVSPVTTPQRGRTATRTLLPSTPSGIRAASLDSPDATTVDGGMPAASEESTEVLGEASAPPRRPVWFVPALASAVSLAIGVLLGAMIFGGKGGPDKPPAPPLASLAPPCPVAPAAAPAPPAPTAAAAAALAAPDAAVAPATASTEATPPAPPLPSAEALAAVTDGPTLGKGDCHAHLESLPPRAHLRVAGKDVGTAPVDVAGLPCGEPVIIEAEVDKFEPYRRAVIFTLEKPDRFVASLARPRVVLQVSSLPLGALVTVAGRPAGKTPLRTSVNAWVRTPVKISMAGYKDYEAQVAPRPGTTAQVVASLERLPKGAARPAAPAPRPSSLPSKPGAPGNAGTKPAPAPAKKPTR